MKNMYIVILCVIFILLIISNNTLEEGFSTKSTANASKLIGGIRKIPFYNSFSYEFFTIKYWCNDCQNRL